MYPPTKGEETVNVAAVAFLRTLTMGCKEAGLEWESYRKGFIHQLGEAYVRAYTDGCLSSDRKDDVFTLGRMLLSITVQISTDEKVREKKETEQRKATEEEERKQDVEAKREEETGTPSGASFLAHDID